MKIAESLQIKQKLYISIFAVFFTVAAIISCLLEKSTILERQELQTINRRFEARQWLVWSKDSLRRSNPLLLWNYHEEHDIPKQWWAWDYTLSWLLENNHPEAINKIVIFNHSYEDEPPAEAVAQFPWMKPLLNYPLSRKTVSEMVEFLARAGAKLIVLDNDFPQYTPDDKALAKVIHQCSTGFFGKPVPVFMVRAINRGNAGNCAELFVPTAPSGVLLELSKLEPGIDVAKKYTGMTAVELDHDQVVRIIWTKINNGNISKGSKEEDHESIICKVLKATNQPIPKDLPERMGIDFSAPPRSQLYPIRPLNYLLDPEQQERMLSSSSKHDDVSVKDSIIFLGDGITDVYSTPFTNEGLEQRSGTEILAQALDSIARHSWIKRLENEYTYLYILSSSAIGAFIWVIWKVLQQAGGQTKSRKYQSIVRLASDISFSCLILAGTYIIACLIFSYTGLIVPVFVPSIGLGLGTLAAIVWEREREREELFQTKLAASQEKLQFERDKFESELARKEAEVQAREMVQDRKRRHEFVRRINHDLNAPVSVLNWTISELQLLELESAQAREKVLRLVKSSDKLCELIDQLVQSYDYETVPSVSNNQASLCDLLVIIDDCVDGQKPLAQKHNDNINWLKPKKQMIVRANTSDLSRVIDNIIRNAIKHNPPETTVSISAEATNNFYTIRISDNGKGIEAKHLKHIFEPGYRIEPGKRNGQGLGLDIAKTLIESMNGEIGVDSTFGAGTIFYLSLPISRENKIPTEDFANKEKETNVKEPSSAHK